MWQWKTFRRVAPKPHSEKTAIDEYFIITKNRKKKKQIHVELSIWA